MSYFTKLHLFIIFTSISLECSWFWISLQEKSNEWCLSQFVLFTSAFQPQGVSVRDSKEDVYKPIVPVTLNLTLYNWSCVTLTVLNYIFTLAVGSCALM